MLVWTKIAQILGAVAKLSQAVPHFVRKICCLGLMWPKVDEPCLTWIIAGVMWTKTDPDLMSRARHLLQLLLFEPDVA